MFAYTYDAAGNLASATGPGGAMTSYSYDATHRMLTRADPNHGVTTNGYDPASRVVSQTDPAGRTTTWVYTSGETTITDPAGHVRVELFDANGNPTSVTDASGTSSAATATFGYDAASNLTTMTDANHQPSRNIWDARGNQLAHIDPAGDTTLATYDTHNDLVSVTDPLGVTTTMVYNPAGHVTSVSTPIGASAATTTFSYGPVQSADLLATTDATGRVTSYAYDAPGYVVSTTDPAGDVTSSNYDLLGRVTSVVRPAGNKPGGDIAANTITYTYDAVGDVVSVRDPLGHLSTASYDQNRNLVSTTDAHNRTTTLGYDADNEPTRTVRPDGTILATDFNLVGRVIGQTDGLGHRTTYGYDPLNRLAAVTDALNRTTTYTHDAAGNVSSRLDPAGHTTTYAHDGGDRLKSTTYSDGATPNMSFTYDADGQRVGATASNGTWNYTYDALHRLTESTATQITAGVGSDTKYAYDLAGRLTAISYPTPVAQIVSTSPIPPSPTVTRTYDPAGRMATVTDWLGHTVDFGYDANSNLATETFPTDPVNGQPRSPSIDTFAHNAADQLTGIADTGPDGALLNLTYSRDPIGQLSAVTPVTATSGVPLPSATYAYDQTNRLVGARAAASTVAVAATGWAYDHGDNLTQSTGGNLQRSYTYDAANQITDVTQTSAPSAVTQNYAFTYDPNGNRTSGSSGRSGTTTTYKWDQENRLMFTTPTPNTGTISGPTGAAVNQQAGLAPSVGFFGYDPDNLRTDLTWNLAEGMPTILADDVADADNAYVTGPGGLPVELINQAGQVYYYHHDQLGSTIALTTTQGALAQTYAYTPYGQAIPGNTNVVNPFQYAGQYHDPQTGLMYLRARYYDPATGQFLSRDPLVALTQAPYSYAEDDPLNEVDPLGLYPGEGLVHKAEHAVKAIDRAVVDVVAVVPYGVYYVSNKLAQGINAVGCSPDLGPVEPATCVPSHVVAAPLAIPEALGLGGDAAIDAFKGAVFGGESICDEGKRGYLNPLHSFLPDPLKGPQVYLPGINPNGSIDFQW